MNEIEKLEEEIAFWMGDDDDLQAMYAKLENLRDIARHRNDRDDQP